MSIQDNLKLKTQNSKLLDELLTVLDRDIQHIQDSISTLNELRNLVIKRDDAALSELLQKIQGQKDGYAANDAKRRSILKDLADTLGCTVGQISLSVLEEVLKGEKKSQISNVKVKIRELIEKLKKEHLSTALLLLDFVRFNNLLLRAILDLGKTQMISYGPSGATKRQIDTTLVNLRF